MAAPQQKPKQEQKEKPQKQKEEAPEKKKHFQEEQSEEVLVRIAGYDIPGSKKVMPGLTRIKGVGWSLSNAACLKLNVPKTKKIAELTKDEIKQIETFLRNPDIFDFMKNRRRDVESGKTEHFIGTDLEMKKDFDIRRMKKMRSYRGIRHTSKLPVRGQRTRSHFRKKGQPVKTGGKKTQPSTGGKK